jgi:hypothetical protein
MPPSARSSKLGRVTVDKMYVQSRHCPDHADASIEVTRTNFLFISSMKKPEHPLPGYAGHISDSGAEVRVKTAER